MASLLNKSVCVVCDDTDVFVLLVYFYDKMCTKQASMIMSLSIRERDVVDIWATAAKHHIIVNVLLAIHRISVADTVASLHRICKATVLKIAVEGDLSLYQHW